MRRSFVLGLLLIPLLDVIVLVVLARTIGAPATIAIVVLTALVGLMLARFAGRRNLRRIETAIKEGRIPTDSVLEGGMIIGAALLFLTPGLVTDAIGLLAVFGPTRRPLRDGLKRYVIVPYLDRRSGGFVTGEVYVGDFPGHIEDESIDIDIEIEDTDGESDAQSKP